MITALYRLLRPKTFEAVVGQDAIVATLKNQLQSGRLSHAYLFTGTRGTGKTSVAKIFARAVNCQNLQDGNPCNQCSQCLRNLEGRDLNTIEIDAASNNKVEDVRELREDVRYVPTDAEYKIYIVDEVHMLSTGAFNALLKTLEEPPAHIIFILATTDPHKIPDTILSRCQRYDFKRIGIPVIQSAMSSYLREKSVPFEEQALRKIATIADGALRDAYSLLDRCLSLYSGEALTLSKVLDLLGAVDRGVYETVTMALIQKDISALMEQTNNLFMQGRNLSQFLLGEMAFLRDILFYKTVPQAETILNLTEEEGQTVQVISNFAEESYFISVIRMLSRLENEMKYETNQRVLLELTWIKLCKPELNKSLEALEQRIDNLEQKMASGNFCMPVAKVDTVSHNSEIKKEKPISVAAFPEDIKVLIAEWSSLDFKAVHSNAILPRILESSIPFYHQKKDCFLLITDNRVCADYLKQEKYLKALTDFLEEKYQKIYSITVIAKEDYENQFHRTGEELKIAIQKLKEMVDFEVIIQD